MDAKKKQILITVTAMVCVALIACAVGVGVSLQPAAPDSGSDTPQPGSSSASDSRDPDGTSSAGQPSGVPGGTTRRGAVTTAGGGVRTTAVTKTTRTTGQPDYPAEINVVTYGADPTGKTDSTAVLTRLHATGKKIYYPNGTYLFNGLTLDLSGGVRFQSKDGVLAGVPIRTGRPRARRRCATRRPDLRHADRQL